ncbi:MAG: hypothetical protein HQL69_24020, partial [Magnetococcales bacterium]|nr:hypothetical protein [Magnetococcales bacterium]
AVNEAEDPETLFKELVKLVHGLAGRMGEEQAGLLSSRVKVIFSIRTFVWEGVYAQNTLDFKAFKTTQEQEDVALLPRVMLHSFSEEELLEAYKKYATLYCIGTPFKSLLPATRRHLTSPLMLRFVMDAFGCFYPSDQSCKHKDPGEIPATILTNEIFRQYEKERIWNKDACFLYYLAESMWRLRRDAIPFEMFAPSFPKKEHKSLEEGSKLRNQELADNRCQGEGNLAFMLRAYVFEDPVTDRGYLYTCIRRGCKERGSLFGPEKKDYYLIEEINNDSPNCPICDGLTEWVTVDVARSGYLRLQEQNIVQVIDRDPSGEEDLFLRFTYDRWFEYLVSRYLERFILAYPGPETPWQPKPEEIWRLVQHVQGVYVFWGSLKNLLMTLLRDKHLTHDFWHQLVTTPADLWAGDHSSDDGKLQIVRTEHTFRQIVATAFVEFLQEDSKSIEALLKLLAKNAGPKEDTTEEITLECALRMTLGAEKETLNLQDTEVQLLGYGLRSHHARIRAKSAQIMVALLSNQERVVLGLLDQLQVEIMQLVNTKSKLLVEVSKEIIDIFWQSRWSTALGFFKPSEPRGSLRNRMDSFADLVIYLAGRRYKHANVRKQLVLNSAHLLRFVTAPGRWRLLRRLMVWWATSKLCDIYWHNPLGCNYMAIQHWFQHGDQMVVDHRQVIRDIGCWFLSEQKEILANYAPFTQWMALENGLISWLIHSLVPLYLRVPEQRGPLLDKLKKIYETGNDVARYNVIQTLWIAVSPAGIKYDPLSSLFKELTLDYIQGLDGKGLTYHYRMDKSKLLNKYVREKHPDGRQRAFWAHWRKNDHTLEMRHENLPGYGYGEQLIIQEDAVRLDFLLELIKQDRGDDANIGNLKDAIDTLGQLGQRFPKPALETLKEIILYLTDDQFERQVDHQGVDMTIAQLITKALTAIKGTDPLMVNRTVEGLPNTESMRFRHVTLTAPQPQEELKMFYGQMVYQNSFHQHEELREFFGQSIIDSAEVNSTREFLRVFVSNFLSWFEKVDPGPG